MKTVMVIVTLFSAFLLTACGAAQSVSEGTTSVAKALFVWDVRTLHLDFTARAELNTDDSGKSSPVVVRIYQLKDPKSFESATYDDLVEGDRAALGESFITSAELVLKPSTSISLDTPFNKEAEYVGIAALFKEPDLKQNSWRIVLGRRDLNINKARDITVSQFVIELVEKD